MIQRVDCSSTSWKAPLFSRALWGKMLPREVNVHAPHQGRMHDAQSVVRRCLPVRAGRSPASKLSSANRREAYVRLLGVISAHSRGLTTLDQPGEREPLPCVGSPEHVRCTSPTTADSQ